MNVTDAREHAAGQIGYTGAVKNVVNSALKRVGGQRYGKDDVDTYTSWKWNSINCPDHKLNCWTSIVFWAWHGGAISTSWCQRYMEIYIRDITAGMLADLDRRSSDISKQNQIRCRLHGQNTANFLGTTRTGTEMFNAPIGRTVFFESPLTGPMAHVGLSLGGGWVISNWAVPTCTDNQFLHDGLVSIETIAKIARHVGDCKITMTRKPLWELGTCVA